MIDFFDPRTDEEKNLSVMIEFLDARGDLDREILEIQRDISAAYRELCRIVQIKELYGLKDKSKEYVEKAKGLLKGMSNLMSEYFEDEND